MDMRDHIREKSDLAHTYAEDGAYHSAARILTQLAQAVAAHARAIDIDMGLPARPTQAVTIELACAARAPKARTPSDLQDRMPS